MPKSYERTVEWSAFFSSRPTQGSPRGEPTRRFVPRDLARMAHLGGVVLIGKASGDAPGPPSRHFASASRRQIRPEVDCRRASYASIGSVQLGQPTRRDYGVRFPHPQSWAPPSFAAAAEGHSCARRAQRAITLMGGDSSVPRTTENTQREKRYPSDALRHTHFAHPQRPPSRHQCSAAIGEGMGAWDCPATREGASLSCCSSRHQPRFDDIGWDRGLKHG